MTHDGKDMPPLYLKEHFLDKGRVDLTIINGDQMPLHRNESSQEKTLNFKGEDTLSKKITCCQEKE